MTDHEKQIIENEIRRLERAYKVAQERYGFTGSYSSDRTMEKYQVLMDTLHDVLYHNSDESKNRQLAIMWDQLARLKKRVALLREGGMIADNVAADLMEIIKA